MKKIYEKNILRKKIKFCKIYIFKFVKYFIKKNNLFSVDQENILSWLFIFHKINIQKCKKYFLKYYFTDPRFHCKRIFIWHTIFTLLPFLLLQNKLDFIAKEKFAAFSPTQCIPFHGAVKFNIATQLWSRTQGVHLSGWWKENYNNQHSHFIVYFLPFQFSFPFWDAPCVGFELQKQNSYSFFPLRFQRERSIQFHWLGACECMVPISLTRASFSHEDSQNHLSDNGGVHLKLKQAMH